MATIARPRPARLQSLKDAPASRIGKAGVGPISRPKPKGPPRCCEAPDLRNDNGTQACMNCGTVITESEIVSEVTFGENSNGAAVVQGAFVGENQRHAKTMGPAFRRNGGATDSREDTERKGKAEINRIGAAVGLSNPSTEDQAFGIYKLAIGINFIQGRRVRTVAAVCLYIACRRKPGNTFLLMDFAAALQMNVWALGDVYKALTHDLWFGEPDASGVPAVLEVEPLVEKFAAKLEFGEDTRQVATDAVRILRRMKRDWMVEGRQPAGLVGACIIIAARQNNYRRTVREVVYVVKVCDNTIFQRLLEFKRTQAASLTIDQFRKIGHRLKVKAEPPAIYTRREREERMEERKKRKHSEMSRETIEIPDEDTQAGAAQTPPPTQRSSRSSSSPAVQSDSQPLRRDPDGFLIPNPPIDRALLEATNLAHQELLASENADNTPKQPTEKRRKKANKPPIEVPEEDLEIEGDLEDEIQHILSEQEIDDAASSARAEALATRLRGPPTVPIAEDVDEHEFDDDPEVANAVCTPAEVELRERIWVTENEAWLRERQEKMLQKALEQASGGPKKKQQRRKHSQMGDGSVLGGSPAASPAEAVEKMLGKRATKGFSKFINYENLNQLYPKGDARVDSVEASGDTTPQAGGAASPSVWAQQSPRAAAEAVEVEEEEEEEDEEEEDEDEVDAEAEIFDQFEHEEYYDDDE